MEPILLAISDELVRVEVPGDKTCATLTLKKGERYKCSVQVRNWCQLLSNHSDSIEVYVPGKDFHNFSLSYNLYPLIIADDVTVTDKTNTTVIIGVLFTIATVLFLSIVAVGCALISQRRRYIT